MKWLEKTSHSQSETPANWFAIMRTTKSSGAEQPPTPRNTLLLLAVRHPKQLDWPSSFDCLTLPPIRERPAKQVRATGTRKKQPNTLEPESKFEGAADGDVIGAADKR
jgi:hypothetical protein